MRPTFEQQPQRQPFREPLGTLARVGRGASIVLSLLVLSACSVAAEADETADERLVVHALVQVRRTEALGEEPRADALAGLIRVPDTADAAEVFALAGLRDRLPPVGQCLSGGELTEASPTEAELGLPSVELVPADTVQVLTPGGAHLLAPHAFPSVSDSIRGVIYTSRDQTAGSLPDGGRYEIVLRGAEGLENERAVHQGPGVPAGITIGGVPLAEVDSLTSPDLDVTWTPSESTLDVLAARLRTGEGTYTCAFRDSDGFGSLSLVEAARAMPSFAEGREARGTLSLHRIRAEASAAPGDTSVIEVRFDFSLAREVHIALSTREGATLPEAVREGTEDPALPERPPSAE